MTSHDGTVALQFFDSMTRIICNNTLQMSLAGDKTMHLKIRHTVGAGLQLKHISEFLNQLLGNRERFATALTQLAKRKVKEGETYDAITGWQYERLGRPVNLSNRTRNAIGEICHLFGTGLGNQGKTRYDAWNGVTGYYSNGSGAGTQGPAIQRVANGLFGNAASLKASFTKRILEPGGWESMVEAGRTANSRGSTVFLSAEKKGVAGRN